MKAQGVPCFEAWALEDWEQGLHSVPRKGISERVSVVEGVKNVTRHKAGVERHGHGRVGGAKELRKKAAKKVQKTRLKPVLPAFSSIRSDGLAAVHFQ